MPKCNTLGCLNKAIKRGFCSTHGGVLHDDKKYHTSRVRPQYHSLYNTAWWTRTRKHIINNNPLCSRCSLFGITKAAKDIDHVIPHRGNEQLFYDASNLQPLCRECHTWKTNMEGNEKFEVGMHWPRGLDFRSKGDK